MRLAFYIAESGTWLDWLINQCSGRRGFSHVELVFSDGTFFSSSPRDGGVRFKQIDRDPKHWVFVDVPMSDDTEVWLRSFCDCELGKKYDWLGVINFVVPPLTELVIKMIHDLLASLYQRAELLSLLKADMELYTRWKALRSADVEKSLLRSCEISQIDKEMHGYGLTLVTRVDELIQARHFDVAAELLPDLIESLCSIAHGRYMLAGGVGSPRRDEAVRAVDASDCYEFALAA